MLEPVAGILASRDLICRSLGRSQTVFHPRMVVSLLLLHVSKRA